MEPFGSILHIGSLTHKNTHTHTITQKELGSFFRAERSHSTCVSVCMCVFAVSTALPQCMCVSRAAVFISNWSVSHPKYSRPSLGTESSSTAGASELHGGQHQRRCECVCVCGCSLPANKNNTKRSNKTVPTTSKKTQFPVRRAV